jgi:hypothetical protein
MGARDTEAAVSALRLVSRGEDTVSIALDAAQLCPESTCQEVFSLSDVKCPKCGSEGMAIQRLLDGRPDYAPLVAAAKDLLLLGSNLSVRQRRTLIAALHVAGVTL